MRWENSEKSLIEVITNLKKTFKNKEDVGEKIKPAKAKPKPPPRPIPFQPFQYHGVGVGPAGVGVGPAGDAPPPPPPPPPPIGMLNNTLPNDTDLGAFGEPDFMDEIKNVIVKNPKKVALALAGLALWSEMNGSKKKKRILFEWY